MTQSSYFRFDKSLTRELDNLALTWNTDKATVLRRAIALYKVAVDAKKDGMTMHLVTDNSDRQIIY